MLLLAVATPSTPCGLPRFSSSAPSASSHLLSAGLAKGSRKKSEPESIVNVSALCLAATSVAPSKAGPNGCVMMMKSFTSNMIETEEEV